MTRALFILTNLPAIILFARAIGYEAPAWASQDRPYVAACIRYRMVSRDLTVHQVLFAPHQFSVAHLLDHDPSGEDMTALVSLAIDTLMDDDPLAISHFYSPLYVDVPSWARDEWRVETGETVHRFYLLPKWSKHD